VICHALAEAMLVLFLPPRVARRRFKGIAASANPRLRLAGIAGLLLPGIDNGCWR
jgi:uncharacterized protein YjeT (DUF2065 family)